MVFLLVKLSIIPHILSIGQEGKRAKGKKERKMEKTRDGCRDR